MYHMDLGLAVLGEWAVFHANGSGIFSLQRLAISLHRILLQDISLVKDPPFPVGR